MKDKTGNELNDGDILYSEQSPHYKVRVKRIDKYEITLEWDYHDPLIARTFRLREKELLNSVWRKEIKVDKPKRISRAKQPSRQFDPETMAWI